LTKHRKGKLQFIPSPFGRGTEFYPLFGTVPFREKKIRKERNIAI